MELNDLCRVIQKVPSPSWRMNSDGLGVLDFDGGAIDAKGASWLGVVSGVGDWHASPDERHRCRSGGGEAGAIHRVHVEVTGMEKLGVTATTAMWACEVVLAHITNHGLSLRDGATVSVCGCCRLRLYMSNVDRLRVASNGFAPLPTTRILVGDARDRLRDLPDASVHCVVTSPPYWGQRSYDESDGMIGLEEPLGEHIENLLAVFREVRRVLRADGTSLG